MSATSRIKDVRKALEELGVTPEGLGVTTEGEPILGIEDLDSAIVDLKSVMLLLVDEV